jgi:hypothetical protein
MTCHSIEKALTAIQGRVDIEQAESDRNLQNTIRIEVLLLKKAILKAAKSQLWLESVYLSFLKTPHLIYTPIQRMGDVHR